MSDELIMRTFRVKVAEADATGRIVTARVVPYNVETRVQDPGKPPYMEVFVAGAFKRAIRAANRVALRFHHRAGITDLLGRAISFTEADDGLDGEFKVVRGAVGDHALALVDDGVVTGVSIGFASLSRREQKTATGAVIRDNVHLGEVSLTPEPAYAGAAVTGRRTAASPEVFVPDAAELERLRAIGIAV